MRVFVTGATGFVGSAVVQELIKAGHEVLGLTRSDEGAKALISAGAQVHRGDLEDLESLKSGVAATDGVIHTGFIHDFTQYKESCEIDRRAIEAMGSVLIGSGRPLIVTSGIAIAAKSERLVTEEDQYSPSSPVPRIATEQAAEALAEKGVHVSVVRLPPTVHDNGDHGFVPMLIGIARETGISIYKEQGLNRWPAVHRLDAALLFRLALEKNLAGGTNFHAVAEEGIAFHEIATAIGKGLHIQVAGKSAVEADAHFGWFAHFAGLDCPASSSDTKEKLGWHPVQRGLIADLENGDYFTL